MIIQHLKEIHYLISASAKLLLASNYLLKLLISHNIQFSPIRSFFIINGLRIFYEVANNNN